MNCFRIQQRRSLESCRCRLFHDGSGEVTPYTGTWLAATRVVGGSGGGSGGEVIQKRRRAIKHTSSLIKESITTNITKNKKQKKKERRICTKHTHAESINLGIPGQNKNERSPMETNSSSLFVMHSA